MLEEFIIQLINKSLQAAVAICAVLVVRLLFVKLHISKKYVSLLWLVPYLCLVLPFRVESNFSFWGMLNGLGAEQFEILKMVEHGTLTDESKYSAVRDVITNTMDYGTDNALGEALYEYETDIVYDADVNAGTEMPGLAEAGEVSEAFLVQEGLTEELTKDILHILASVWFVGVAVLMVYNMITYIRLRRKVICSECMEDNIYFADDIGVPFVLGILQPKIYLPSAMEKSGLQYVVEHEKTHIMRRDSLKKAAAYFITTIYWFNPFVWLAFLFLGKDIEMACDEETIQRIGMEKRKDYASTLLLLSTGRSSFSGALLTFGEGDTKGRIHNIMKYKKTLGIVAVVAVAVVLVMGVGFLTSPKEAALGDLTGNNRETSEGDVEGQQETKQFEVTKQQEIGLQESKQQESGEFKVEIIPVTLPLISRDTISGTDGPILDFASEEMIVFHDYYGLFIYSLEEGMVGAIDLEAIGCHDTQGDGACEVLVEEDGSKVYMHIMNAEDMYVYDAKEAILYKDKYDKDKMNAFFKIKDINNCIVPDYTVLRSNGCVVLANQRYHYLESGSGLPIDMVWAVEQYTGTLPKERVQYISLFEGYEEYLQGNIPKRELTMEELIGLCEESDTALKESMAAQGLGALSYNNFIKQDIYTSLTWMYVCPLTYGERNYELQVYFWKERAQEYGHTENELDSIRLVERNSGDGKLLYTSEEGYSADLDIRTFLEREYDMSLYLTLKLPQGLSMGEYHINMNGIWDGCVFFGDYEAPPHGMCQESWYAPGGVGVYQMLNDTNRATFENGKLSYVAWDFNHGSRETEGESLEGCNKQAILYEYSFDLFTAAEAEEYKEKYGVTDDKMQHTSRYWYVFFAEPNSDMLYTIFLNQEYFEKEDIVALARSVEFAE